METMDSYLARVRGMKVLLSDTCASRGASSFVATMARTLSRRGHVVDVILGYGATAEVDAYAGGVREVFRPPCNYTEVVLRGDYDVLHVTEQDLCPPFECGVRARRLGLRARVVVTVHAEHAVVRKGADVLTFVSEHSMSTATGDKHSAIVVPMGVDATSLRETANSVFLSGVDVPVAMWVGRVNDGTRQKDFLGFGYAIEDIRRLGWHVLVVDDSPPADDFPAEQQLRRWFGEGVHYENQVPGPVLAGALSRAGQNGGVLVSSSRTEATPFVELEALALGTPVVAPRIPPFERLISAGHATGYTTVASLVEVLRQRTFETAFSALPSDASADIMVDAYIALYAAAGRATSSDARSRGLRAPARSAVSRKADVVLSFLQKARG